MVCVNRGRGQRGGVSVDGEQLLDLQTDGGGHLLSGRQVDGVPL